ncbi:MAG TPA: FG-GAP-like repeat-containing protein [Anaerolineae bacterium]|nr:FG-GAP-like repeat-containing protein [Anaerolineae bacterium]
MMSQHSSVERLSRLFASILLAAGLLAGMLLLASSVWAAPGVPPEEIHPSRNAITATLTTTIFVTYDEPISETTVTSHTFAVHGMQSGLVTATHGARGGTIIVTPTRPFHQGELAYAIATTRTLNITGTGPISGTQWQFNAGQVTDRCVAGFIVDTAASANLTGVYASSVAWGDYDNDGDLDILLTGVDSGNGYHALVYENQAGVFVADTAASANLTGVAYSSVAWGDYDNDGDLDILLTGVDSGFVPNALVYENRAGAFVTDTVASANLTGVYYSSVAWGDYDNDGDLDILLTGTPSGPNGVAYVYENTGSGFVTDIAASANLTGVYASSVAWGDYDNDGDLDILLTGQDSGGGRQALIYENQAGVFVADTVASANLTGVYYSSVAWGDYDNDGDLDILLTGQDSGGRQALVYENQPGAFVTDSVASANLTGVYRSSVAWGDYDDDGDLDILLTGLDSGFVPNALIYRNDDCVVDLVIAKTADPDPAVAGTGLTYTLVITNRGNVSATNVTISDTLPPSATLRTLDQTDDTGAEFDAGTHANTRWLDPFPERGGEERLTLSDTLRATGVFTSRVFDAGSAGAWETLAWTPRRPTGKPLPDDGAAETAYALGDVNMVGNRLLEHLDETSAPFADTSGQGNDGVCTAPACPTAGAGGRFNSALAFDGADDIVTIADPVDPARYALELWVYPETVADTSLLLRTDAVSGTQHHYSHLLGIADGHFLHLSNAGGEEHRITGTTVIAPATWYHVVGTAESGGELKLYVNGQEEARAGGLGALWSGGDRYVLGASYGLTGTTPFHGRLDEVAVYSRTLSAAEVTDHYLRGALRLDFYVRTCDQPDCSDGVWNGPTSEEDNANLGLPTVAFAPPLADARYAQYRATLATDDPAYAPELRRVALGPDHYDVTAEPEGICAATSGAFTCTLGVLDAGDVATVTARTVLHPSALGPITNTAHVTATGEISPTDNVVTVTTQVTSEVWLRVVKYDDDRDLPYWYDATHGMADPVNPGSPLTYTLLVHNSGPSTAWDVVVSDTLPVTPTGVITLAGWTCDTVGRAITCTTTALLRWHWDDIVVTGAAPTVIGTITNTARITATGSTVRAGSSLTDTITTTVVPLADLVIAKTATPDPVNPGETITYTLTVTNTGPYTATGVVLTDTLPAGLIHDDAIASSPPWDGCVSSDEHIICRMGEELLPTQSASLQLIVTAPLSGLIENHAIVTSDVFDPELENNEIHLYTAVRPVADLSVAKHDTPDPVDAAAPLTYTVIISNAGPVGAGALTTTVSARTHRNVRVPIGGTAWPYPSSLWLNSVPGRVRELTVTLYGLQHTYPADLVALLTGPGGQSTVLMANAGGGTDADDLTLTFHETGAALPVSDPLTSTTVYRPTNHGFGESLPDPAPAGPYGSGFSPFYGGSPNGAWRLYVYDTFDSDGGRIADGWGLELVAVTTDTVTLSDTLPSGLTGVVPSLPGWGCTTGEDVVCTGDRLARHETVTLTLAATAPITPGVITNTASITSTLADLDLTHNTARITTTVSPVANLGIALYLPLVMRNYAIAPDLVVDSIVATADTVTVTISNQGDVPITRTFANEFWVDVYIEPDPTPTRVNQTWAHLGSQGLLWGITQDALPLDPGETLVLTTSRDHDGAYFWPQESVITWPLPAGTEIWAQVDSAHAETEYGGVLENHEIVGAPYVEGGNILGPVFSTGGSAGSISPSATGGQRRQPPLEHHLPPRP